MPREAGYVVRRSNSILLRAWSGEIAGELHQLNAHYYVILKMFHNEDQKLCPSRCTALRCRVECGAECKRKSNQCFNRCTRALLG